MKKNKLYTNLLAISVFSFAIYGLIPANAQGMMDQNSNNKEFMRPKEGMRMVYGERGREDKKDMGMPRGMMRGETFGTVTSVNGNTITISSFLPGEREGNKNASSTPMTYTVDATNAIIIKNGATSSLSNISVGDKIAVNGQVNGSTITAKIIHDGMMMGQGGDKDWRNASSTASSTNPDIHNNQENHGFFGKAKNFFKRMFGFGHRD